MCIRTVDIININEQNKAIKRDLVYIFLLDKCVVRDSLVGIATCYWLDDLGIETFPIPVAASSKTWACGHSLAGIAGFRRDTDLCVMCF